MDRSHLSPRDAARAAAAEELLVEAMRRAGVAPPPPGAHPSREEGDRIMDQLLAMGGRPLKVGPPSELREKPIAVLFPFHS